ncbi:NfeD family protein [Desertivirga arenae]|uniref:NfeD family protein n=1 Tax=Desertivirga arenae TaxID=2810309 RepID=UPI001A95B998|nr:NfeD family protein [Pedobacter sp. SYSU D00823]
MQYLKQLLLIFLLSLSLPLLAQKQTVYVFEMKDEIGPAAWRLTQKAFAKAKESGAEAIIIDMNTYGGMVEYADSIRTKILNSPIRTIVFIENNAASAGALISIACDKIYMSPSANIGAASVVNEKGEVLPEKYQSYMRGRMRATAEATKRNPLIAEGFVDPEVEIPGLKPKGKVLTLTATEALKVGYCDAEVAGIDAVIKAEDLGGSTIINHQVSLLDKVLSFLISPAISGLLIILIIGGIYFEMQAPGIGFALLVSVVASLLYFAPLYLEGLAEHWEIGLFLLGIILLLLEVFVIPGFGVAGILGIVCLIAGLALSLVLNDWFDFTVTGPEKLTTAVLTVIGAMVAAIIVSVIFGKSLMRSPVFQRLVLQDEQRSQQGYVSGRQVGALIDKTGVAKTDLRPSGKIVIDGKWYDGVSLDGFINQGSEVLVVKQENYNVFVRKINS